MSAGLTTCYVNYLQRTEYRDLRSCQLKPGAYLRGWDERDRIPLPRRTKKVDDFLNLDVYKRQLLCWRRSSPPILWVDAGL